MSEAQPAFAQLFWFISISLPIERSKRFLDSLGLTIRLTDEGESGIQALANPNDRKPIRLQG